MRFIHISDVRLFAESEKDTEWKNARQKEIEETFENVLSECNEKDVDLLLIAGNLFDHSPSIENLEWLDERLRGLEKTRTVILSGNMDFLDQSSDEDNFRFKSRTVLLPAGRTTNAYLRGINTCVTGFSYAKPVYHDRIIEGIEPGREGAINILVGCGGSAESMPFSKEKIARKAFDYVALGGYSKPVHILKDRMVYSGSPEPVVHTSEGKHGMILGEITDEGVKISFVPMAKRRYYTIDVTLSPDLSDEAVCQNLEEKMMKLGNENIYSIVFRGFSGEQVLPRLGRIEKRFYIYDVADLTISEADEKAMLSENRENMMGKFIREIESSYNIDDNIRSRALRYGMEALIMAGDEN